MAASSTPLVAVVGASGGIGTSCVAAALAHGLRRATGRGVLVDLDAGGSGIDVLLGIEDEPGARWPALADARGDVDGRGLLASLPRWGSVPVLSGLRNVPSAPDDDVVLDVCAALLRAGEAVVADLPRPGAWTPAVRALVTGAEDILVVAAATLPGAAGAVAVARTLAGVAEGRVRLVVHRTQPGGPPADDLETLTGLEVVAQVGRDRGLAAAIERGEGPRVGRGTRLARLAEELVAATGADRATGPRGVGAVQSGVVGDGVLRSAR
ncbi:flp pilus assembly protein FlpE [Xylanimonas cellulosilytica DSM 15894]|uniref:Flp pilus assembly protein FlpE n=1 Tax=Xylanimonas cellulosilytica (strain DSM 15894 / JCM 12276 / CECT 5975 / KCTC 9989 / LMG 20990 / NBRC 107835 / XIL07) TaxID=446471 RepID=D1BV91_XYLCX|nr:pilus assembly protein FlpE [Xylanimonas cellulosilytica]ACZ29362.1 flp pilus assembly protein FlpE [Xylanimonas cellulosilytica DSM 15894]